MKFTLYLRSHQRDIWTSHYVQYSELKKLLQDTLDAPHAVYVPTKLSLSTGPSIVSPSGRGSAARVTYGNKSGMFSLKIGINDDFTAQELFFLSLEKEVARINEFTLSYSNQLRDQLSDLKGKIHTADLSENTERHALMEIAKAIGDEYLELEKYCNLNYAGLQKILKKHDKLLPHVPCFHFYKMHVASQPWVRGDHQDVQMSLSRIFAELHRIHGTVDISMVEHSHEDYTRTFWVRQQDLGLVRLVLLQHLPVSEEPMDRFEASGMIVNTLCLDSNSLELYHNILYGRPYSTQIQLSWRGLGTPSAVQVQRKVYKEGWKPETAVRDSFPLQESKVTEFLLGRLTFAQAHKFMKDQQRLMSGASKLSEADEVAFEYKLFKAYSEIQRLVESKSLAPMVRIIHKEEVYEDVTGVQGKPGIKVEVETEIEALLEHSYDGMNNLANGIWHQEHPADRVEFPYALLKVLMPISSSCEAQLPSWIQPLVDQGLMTEVYDFSKMAFGICGLLPDMVRGVPVWIDDHELQRYLYVNIMQKDSTDILEEDAGFLEHEEHNDADSGMEEEDAFDSEHASLLKKSGSLRAKNGESKLGKNSLARASQVSQSSQTSASPLYSSEGRRKLLERASLKMRSGMAGWQAKLIQRQGSCGDVYQGQTVMRMEPTQNFGNERIFLKWLSLSITLAGISVGMLGFASQADFDPSELPSIHIAEVSALMLMACAIYMCGYALVLFLWRAPRLSLTHAPRYDDTNGTLYLNVLVVVAFSTLFWLNVADFVEVLKGDYDDAFSPSPPRPSFALPTGHILE